MSLNVVYLASGSGSTFEALARAHLSGRLKGMACGLIVDRKCDAIQRAEDLKIEVVEITPKDFETFDLWDEELKKHLLRMKADWIVSVGFLRKIGPAVIKAFPSKILNTHPSYLPDFGGRGMYGDRVHQAVLDAGHTESGVSLHFVNEIYDEGQIYAQRRVPVQSDDTLESLRDRVQKIEKEFLVEVLSGLFTEERAK